MERLDSDKALDTLSRFADTALKWRNLISDVATASTEDYSALGESLIKV